MGKHDLKCRSLDEAFRKRTRRSTGISIAPEFSIWLKAQDGGDFPADGMQVAEWAAFLK
jgi:hypothetical protein